jgi:hypothetical protein
LAHTGGCARLEGVDVVLESGIICKNNLNYYESLVCIKEIEKENLK